MFGRRKDERRTDSGDFLTFMVADEAASCKNPYKQPCAKGKDKKSKIRRDWLDDLDELEV